MRWLAVFLFATFNVAFAQNQCKTTFTVATQDLLNNVNQGLAKDDLKWFQKKMSKKYSDVCYTENAQDVVFYLSMAPATYHGYRTLTHENTTQSPTHGTVTDTYGQEVGTVDGTTEITTTSHQTVPVTVPYKVLTLTVQNGQRVFQRFQGETLHPTMYGVCTHNCHPTRHLIEQAVKWVHAGGLSDPRQSVADVN